MQGNISRQEAVSMIPPLFLNVEPHHMVRAASPPGILRDLGDLILSTLACYAGSRHVCGARLKSLFYIVAHRSSIDAFLDRPALGGNAYTFY